MAVEAPPAMCDETDFRWGEVCPRCHVRTPAPRPMTSWKGSKRYSCEAKTCPLPFGHDGPHSKGKR